MPTKPTERSNFATDPGAEKTEPSASLKADGYSFQDIPTNDNINYLFNLYYLWETYFDESIDDLNTFVGFLNTFVGDLNTSVGVLSTQVSGLEDHVDSDSVDGVLSFINTLVAISLLRVINETGDVLIQSSDSQVTDSAINKATFKRNKTFLETYAFNSATDVTDDIVRNSAIEIRTQKDGYHTKCFNNYEWMLTTDIPPSTISTISRYMNEVCSGSRSIANFNALLQGAVPDDLTQEQVDYLKLETEDQAYGTNTFGIGALKLSGNNWTVSNGDYDEYVSNSFIGVNASWGGGFFKQDRKCAGMSSSSSRMCGFNLLPGGRGIQVVTQTTGQSHGTTLTAGSNYTDGPYVSMGGTSWTTASDERLKTIVSEIENPLEILSKIKTVYAYYNDKSEKEMKPMFLAQNMYDVLPGIVDNPENPDGFMGVDYDGTVPVLVSGVNHLSKENEELKETINLLMKRVEKLEDGRTK